LTKPLYFYNGTTFELVGPTTPQSPIAYQTSAPTAPATGDIWIDSDGDVDTYNRQLTRYYFVATAGQTSVSGVDANGLTLAYVAGSEAVYVNGALQVRGQDYTATNGTSVVMSSALALNDVVEIFAYTAFTVANAYTKSETDGVAAAAAGLRMVVPASVTVGSGSSTISATGEVGFTSVSSVSLNTCFSSTYDNYLIVFQVSSTSGNPSISFRMRSGTTDETGNNYSYSGIKTPSGGAVTLDAAVSTSSAKFVENYASYPYHISGNLDLFNPFNAVTTKYAFNSYGSNTAGAYSGFTYYGAHSQAISYNGITFLPSTGTMSGVVRVYGLKN